MSLIFSVSMFFLSFMPLWVSVLFLDIMNLINETSNLWTEYIVITLLGIATVISMIILLVVLNKKDSDSNYEYVLISAKEEKTISVEFLLSYILPLFTFDFTKWQEVILFLIFFLTLGWLTIKHNRFTVNIVLELLGYRVYECIIENADSRKIETRIISKRLLTVQTEKEIWLDSINNEFKIDHTMMQLK